jgi:hypothetical protein
MQIFIIRSAKILLIWVYVDVPKAHVRVIVCDSNVLLVSGVKRRKFFHSGTCFVPIRKATPKVLCFSLQDPETMKTES